MHSEATTSSEVSQLRRDIDELKGSLDRERLARVQAEESQREAQRLSKTALEREQKRTLRTSVLSRSAVLAIALVSLWAVVAAIASAQGSGETVFQKLTGAGLWFGAAFALIAAISPFVMGKERLRLIKTWKGEAE
jgi:ABC-type transport system involved in cytochrome bd biosynthesis fused ATPase/permease subunit